MKALRSVELFTTPRFVLITAFGIIFFTFFYVGTFWSEFDRYNPLSFFFTTRQSRLSPSVLDLSANSNVTRFNTSSSLLSNHTTNVSSISLPVIPSAAPSPPSPSPSIVDLSANSNATLSDTSSSLVSNQTTNVSAISVPVLPAAAPPPPSPSVVDLSANSNVTLSDTSSSLVSNQATNVSAISVPFLPSAPPPPAVATPSPPPDRFGIVDENGAMRDDFIVGEFDPNLPETLEKAPERVDSGGMAKMQKFRLCPLSMKDIIPCLDNVEEIRKLNSTERGEKFERHCPREGKILNCLVPAPKGYKAPIPWPKSRDQVWYRNVPGPHLAEDTGSQIWISIDKDKFKFSGGGNQFIHGVDHYMNQISQMVPDIAFGKRTTVVLDVGCGVASFGAFLLSRNVTTLSIAPKDVHDNQIQFALERGVPAMVAAFTTKRLPYPSQAFDMIHCSWCQINWTRDDGILLLEVNRMLRAGGYFAWAAEPVYKHEESQQEAWKEMENLTARICWELIKKEGYVAIWQKPLDNNCYVSRAAGVVPPLCETDNDPDNVWYVDLKACITRFPDNGYGAGITNWPTRLHRPPNRLQAVKMDAYTSKDELFMAESKDWNEIVASYVKSYHWKQINMRNVMDMRAGFGGFAAALVDLQLNAWVMNVVPVSGPNTLPVIYDRGLVGVLHDWCEPFDTYPRTYDLLHASSLFSKEKKRCDISKIMLEMNRMLRPGGRAYIRDTTSIIEEVQEIAVAMGWRTSIHDPSEGPYTSRRILKCEKKLRRS